MPRAARLGMGGTRPPPTDKQGTRPPRQKQSAPSRTRACPIAAVRNPGAPDRPFGRGRFASRSRSRDPWMLDRHGRCNALGMCTRMESPASTKGIPAQPRRRCPGPIVQGRRSARSCTRWSASMWRPLSPRESKGARTARDIHFTSSKSSSITSVVEIGVGVSLAYDASSVATRSWFLSHVQ